MSNDIKKSDIYYAFERQDKFPKNGSVIRKQINEIVLPRLNSDVNNWTDKANNLLEDCGDAPKKEVSSYWRVERRIQVPFRIYDWCELDYFENKISHGFESLSASECEEKKGNNPSSAEEAGKRREYNDAVNMICNILTDIKVCEILLRNIEDDKDYTLNMNQMLALDF